MILVFEIWSILYSTLATSELWTCENLYEISANLIQTLTSEVGDSIQNHPGPGGGAPDGEYEGPSPPRWGV